MCVHVYGSRLCVRVCWDKGVCVGACLKNVFAYMFVYMLNGNMPVCECIFHSLVFVQMQDIRKSVVCLST